MFTQTAERFSPRFQVEKLEGKLKKKVFQYKVSKDPITDRIIRKRVESDIEVDAGYMVYTAKGGSIHFWLHKALVAAGFGKPSEIIDTETGEVVPTQQYTLKELVTANHMKKSMNRPQASGVVHEAQPALNLG